MSSPGEYPGAISTLPAVIAPPERSAGEKLEPQVRRLLLGLAFLALLALYVGRIGGFPLQDPDEGRYAEIAREMAESGDWVTPHLNYVSYFHKPPLLYWATAISVGVLGENEFAARLPIALSGVLVVMLTYILGRPMFGDRSAVLAAAFLATTPLFFVLSQAVVIDMLLAACMTAALASLYALHVTEAKRGWAASTAFWVGLGFLAKGPVSVVLVGMVAAPFLAMRKDWAGLRELITWRPILVFIAVVAPWLTLVSLRNPDFLEVFFVEHHLRRFSGQVGHPAGPFYFVPVLLAGAAPWTVLAGLMTLDRDSRAAFSSLPSTPRLFLGLWAGVIVGFFSLSSTKLPTYVVPALPALALLLGAWMDGLLKLSGAATRPIRRLAATTTGVGVVALAVATFASLFPDWLALQLRVEGGDVRAMIGPVGGVGVALAATGSTVALWSSGLQLQPNGAVGVLLVGMGIALFSAVSGRAVVKNSRDLAWAIRDERRPGDLVVAFDHLLHGLPFYLRQRTIQAGDAGEMAPGAARSVDRADYFWKKDRLVRTWESGQRMFVATDVRRLHELPDDLSPAPHVLARDLKRVVLVNFPTKDDPDDPTSRYTPRDMALNSPATAEPPEPATKARCDTPGEKETEMQCKISGGRSVRPWASSLGAVAMTVLAFAQPANSSATERLAGMGEMGTMGDNDKINDMPAEGSHGGAKPGKENHMGDMHKMDGKMNKMHGDMKKMHDGGESAPDAKHDHAEDASER